MISPAHELALTYCLYAEAFMYICFGLASMLIAVNGLRVKTKKENSYE